MADDGKRPGAEEPAERPYSEHIDPFLETVVKLINELNDLSFGFTVNVGGVLVSGLLVSQKTYFEGLAGEITRTSQGTNLQLSDAVSKMWSMYGEKVDQIRAENPKLRPRHIHLKDARFFHPNGNPIPTDKGVWWRGKLSAIDGFIMGSMSRT